MINYIYVVHKAQEGAHPTLAPPTFGGLHCCQQDSYRGGKPRASICNQSRESWLRRAPAASAAS